MDNKNQNTHLYIVAAVFIIVGAVFLFRSLKDKALVEDEGFKDFNELSYTELEDGMLVEGEFIEAYDPFAETYETRYGIRFSDDSEQLYYVVPAGNEEEYETLEYRYIGFLCGQTWFDRMDDLIDETDEYYSDEFATDPVPVSFTAKVRDMTDEEIGWMEEYFISSGISEDEMDYYMHPVVLEVYSKEGYKAGLWVGFGAVAIGGVILVIALVLRAKKKKEENVYY